MSNYQHFTFRTEAKDENYAVQIQQLLTGHYGGSIDDKSNGERTGIYLATNTAGVRESVAFWKNVLEQTPAFANPANFPWTLSNAPASFFARLLGVKGPVITMVGRSDAMAYCFSRAGGDFRKGLIDTAWVISIHHQGEILSMGIFYASGIANMKEIDHLALAIRPPEPHSLNPDAVSSMQQMLSSSAIS